jgi:endoglycosylceramidase
VGRERDYAGAWKALATRFAKDPTIIGYDIINEPYAGSDFEALEALSRVVPEDGGKSKTFDQTKLGPFYQRMIDAIRTVDPDHWVFLEPRYGAPGNGSPSYLPVLKDPRAGEPHLVLAPHLYSTSGEAFGGYTPNDPTVMLWEQERTTERAAQRSPVLLGEWWAFSWTATNARPFAEEILAMADRMSIGWAYWSYGPGTPDSASLYAEDGTDNPAADVVIRPYPRAIAGEPGPWSFDPTTHVLDLKFDQKTGVSGATEIFLPEARVYPKGWTLTVDSDPEGKWSSTFDKTTGIVSVNVDPATTHHHLRVEPKP